MLIFEKRTKQHLKHNNNNNNTRVRPRPPPSHLKTHTNTKNITNNKNKNMKQNRVIIVLKKSILKNISFFVSFKNKKKTQYKKACKAHRCKVKNKTKNLAIPTQTFWQKVTSKLGHISPTKNVSGHNFKNKKQHHKKIPCPKVTIKGRD